MNLKLCPRPFKHFYKSRTAEAMRTLHLLPLGFRVKFYLCFMNHVNKQERFAGPAPRGEGQRLRIRSRAVVALFAFNVSVSSTWLNTTLHYTNAAARRIGHQHRRDYTG
jgi:hypothetical protein